MNNADFQAVRNMSVEGRIIEKRSKLLSEFLREHNLAEPKSVEYRPLAGCEINYCFVNVEAQIKKAGGKMETGWAFFELRDVSIHSIAHAIWITLQGRRIDITPWRFSPNRRILFLPDETVAAKRGYTAGRRTVFTTDSRLRAIESFENDLDQIFDELYVGMGKYMDVPKSRFEEAAARAGIPWETASKAVKHRLNNFGH
jgi:hypothetical protein